jgi:uncharacterized phiE125 gp8 family phage protein
MIYTLKTAPSSYPVTLTEAKDHLRRTDTADDTYVTALITTATAVIENMTSNRFVSQTWTAYLTEFPGESFIKLPFGKVISVTSLKYTDYAGTVTTWAASNYSVDAISSPGKIDLAYDISWPSDVVLRPVNGVAIEWVTGYSAAPVEIKQAILLMISHLYENREPVLTSQFGKATIAAVPMAIDALIADYRMSWGGF